jgi:hypothetical protein
MSTRTTISLLIFAAAFAAAAPAAQAGTRRAGEPAVVVAESRHGNGSVSGPVRRVATGYEVRLPGGTWVGCRRSCAETLRVETVDFWENDGRLVGAGTAQNECGIFGCLELRYPR